jgi:hypothetical protein
MSQLKRHRNELFIFLVLLICYSYFLPRWASWNQNSRLDLVLAIVDERTLTIDNYFQNTGDYAVFNGHHYSDKAPGTAFLGVPIYAAARPILRSAPVQSVLNRLAQSDAFGATLKQEGSGLLIDKIYFAVVLYLVTVTAVSIPAALLGVLIYKFLGIFAEHSLWRISVALLYGLATNAFPYSGSFMSHQIVSFLLMGALYLAFLIRQGRIALPWVMLVGFMLGYAVITEYPTALIAVAIVGYTVLVLPIRRWAVGLVMGGLLPGLLLMVYDWVIFESVLPIGYMHSEMYTDIHSQGFISLVGPDVSALWGITFGSFRGLFFIAPVLLLAIPGFIMWWRQAQYRLEWGVCLWATVSFMLFNGSSVMWQGGFSVGPRYLLPMIPFMTIALGAFLLHWGTRWWARLLALLLGSWSVFAVWAETIGGQSFPDWTPDPLFNYSLPRLMAGDVARNLGMALGLSRLTSLIPLVVMLTLCTLFWATSRSEKGSLFTVITRAILMPRHASQREEQRSDV